MTIPRLLTLADVAAHLRCDLRTVQRMARAGRLPVFRPPGTQLRLVREQDLGPWIDANTRPAKGAA